MKLRFQADSDLHFDIVLGVLRREPTIDFQSAKDRLPSGTPDSDVLRIAARESRILVSHDVTTMPLAFHQILASQATSPGLVLVPQSLPIGRVIDNLILLWAASDAADCENLIIWLPL